MAGSAQPGDSPGSLKFTKFQAPEASLGLIGCAGFAGSRAHERRHGEGMGRQSLCVDALWWRAGGNVAGGGSRRRRLSSGGAATTSALAAACWLGRQLWTSTVAYATAFELPPRTKEVAEARRLTLVIGSWMAGVPKRCEERFVPAPLGQRRLSGRFLPRAFCKVLDLPKPWNKPRPSS